MEEGGASGDGFSHAAKEADMTEPSSHSSEVWTPLKVLQWAVPYLKEKGVDSPRLDVECLLAHALHCDRLKVYLQYDRPLSGEERTFLREAVARRAKREPLAYLLGEREFYGLPFEVNSSVLIPRPESEALVEKAKAEMERLPSEERLALDLGTGSGCLAIALAAVVPDCRVWALDISEEALHTAQKNAIKNGVQDRVVFRQGDWWAGLRPEDPLRFPVILSNPPYISDKERADLSPEIIDFEPWGALFATNNGLACYLVLKDGLEKHLTPGGKAFIEMNSNLHDNIKALWPDDAYVVDNDIHGLPRILTAFIPGIT
jgi:release factor glutamine methyltransferase